MGAVLALGGRGGKVEIKGRQCPAGPENAEAADRVESLEASAGQVAAVRAWLFSSVCS